MTNHLAVIKIVEWYIYHLITGADNSLSLMVSNTASHHMNVVFRLSRKHHVICLLMDHDSRCKTWFRQQYLKKYILHEISWSNAFIHCRGTKSTHRSHTLNVLSFRRFLCCWLLIHETLLACTNSSQLSRVPWHGLVWQVVARHSIFRLRFYCDT